MMEEPKNERPDKTLSLFKAITNFVTCLNDCFGTKQKSLQLYCRLISKTTISDEIPIKRHIDAFNKFCAENKNAIIEKKKDNLTDSKISYNEKVYINMEHIFRNCEKQEEEVIWKHMLTIYALIDPHSKAKEKLKDVLNRDNNSGKETDFLHNIFDKVGSNMEQNGNIADGNPMATVSNMMSSGIFTDIVTNMTEGIENGDLDLGKLMGSMQGMVSSIGEMAGETNHGGDPNMANMLNQMNQMMGNLNNSASRNMNQEDIQNGRMFANDLFNKNIGRTSGATESVATESVATESVMNRSVATESVMNGSVATESVMSGSGVRSNNIEIIEEEMENSEKNIEENNDNVELLDDKITFMNKKKTINEGEKVLINQMSKPEEKKKKKREKKNDIKSEVVDEII